jgi:hypothetical protein
MRSSNPYDVLNIGLPCVTGPNPVSAICQFNFIDRVSPKFHDRLRLCVKPVNMRRLVVLRISEKANSIEPNRAHSDRIPRTVAKESMT